MLYQSPRAAALRAVVLHTTCEPERLRELLVAPVVALLGERTHSGYAHEVTWRSPATSRQPA